jgi:hypothetical protein
MDHEVLYRSVFGYHRPSDLNSGAKVNHNGVRLERSDAPNGNGLAYSLNASVVLSELADRAKRGYGKGLIPTGIAVETELRYGIPEGTQFEMSANRSRRANAAMSTDR